ncbi:polyamine ABC transporter substrate-binding protein [Vibrio sp. RC27]
MRYLIYICLSLVPFSFVFANEKALNLYFWEDTLSPDIIANWEALSDTKISLSHFDNDDERNLLMLNSIELPFDIVLLDNVSAQIFSRQDAFEDLSTLSNRKYNESRWNEACGNNAIPYFWGTVGILYRKDLVSPAPQTWSDLIQPKEKHRGHIGLIEDSVETLLPALKTLGYSPNTDNIDQLKASYHLMTEFNKDVLTYEYALSYVRSHQDSSALHMALAYSGDQFSLNRFFHSDQWDFVTPEGSPFIWVDCIAINSNSKQKEQAKAFLNYLMSPHVAAENALYIGSSPANKAALEFLPDSFKNNPSFFLDKTRLSNATLDQELTPENLSIRAKITNNLFNQYEAQP